MVILFLLVGTVFGASAAAFTIWSGGSILLAIASYSLVGTIGALGSVLALYRIHENGVSEPDWHEHHKASA
jgi:hypothetical protein